MMERPNGPPERIRIVLAPTSSDVHAAARRIAGAVVRTPCLESRTLSEITGARIFVKFENLQFTASFKERGAPCSGSELCDPSKQTVPPTGTVVRSAVITAVGGTLSLTRMVTKSGALPPVGDSTIKRST
jgi:threonine dehydratase